MERHCLISILPEMNERGDEETCIDREEAALNVALYLRCLNREQHKITGAIIQSINDYRNGDTGTERDFFSLMGLVGAAKTFCRTP